MFVSDFYGCWVSDDVAVRRVFRYGSSHVITISSKWDVPRLQLKASLL